ncbi:DUF1510 family protein [Jeotgalibacillus terrae]|uniref:DUF1510 family protein n=1 Tax=Jeotgalibacillus terrae TaxID=587735 RepID=A0ABW5ZKE8_9BACL|nr:DUF1510 family protein [Jeotgalibacillus terrae]MBM7577729.1 outer membrane biosynthesis protein TonB [Jeotgalibacillus terrae]
MNNSRTKLQSKKRKENILLNGSIAVVLLLIAGVSAFIFLGSNENQAAEPEEEKSIAEQVQENASKNDEEKNEDPENNELSVTEIDAEDEDQENNDTNRESDEDNNASETKKEKEKEEEAKKKEEAEKKKREKEERDTAAAEETASPDDGEWKPVGTEQTGQHTSSYVEGSVDWNEKLKAAAYATGLDMNTMTVWWVGNDGGPQNSVVKVSSPDAPAAQYSVHLEWVDKKGWKPVKVDQL